MHTTQGPRKYGEPPYTVALIHGGRMAFVGTPEEVRQSANLAVLEFVTGGEQGGGYERILHV